MDTPQKPLSATAKPSLSPIKQWWENNKEQLACATDMITQAATNQTARYSYAYSFCGCCGAMLHDELSDQKKWPPEYLHVGLRMTVEQLKEKLQSSNDPSVVSYELHHKGVPFSFLWKDE